MPGRRSSECGKAVEASAECPASHVESVVVVETFRGQTMWESVVKVFTLHGHAMAKRA
jgi:transposase